jgi:hypothetical protein
MCDIYSEIPLNNKYTLKIEGQDCKTGHMWGWYYWEGRVWMDRAKECEYGLCTLCASMKIQEWNLLKCFKKGVTMKENDRGGESNQSTL